MTIGYLCPHTNYSSIGAEVLKGSEICRLKKNEKKIRQKNHCLSLIASVPSVKLLLVSVCNVRCVLFCLVVLESKRWKKGVGSISRCKLTPQEGCHTAWGGVLAKETKNRRHRIPVDRSFLVPFYSFVRNLEVCLLNNCICSKSVAATAILGLSVPKIFPMYVVWPWHSHMKSQHFKIFHNNTFHWKIWKQIFSKKSEHKRCSVSCIWPKRSLLKKENLQFRSARIRRFLRIRTARFLMISANYFLGLQMALSSQFLLSNSLSPGSDFHRLSHISSKSVIALLFVCTECLVPCTVNT